MQFVKDFNFFGVDTRQLSVTPIEGPPHSTTEGAVGTIVMDVHDTSKALYKCVDVTDAGTKVWEPLMPFYEKRELLGTGVGGAYSGTALALNVVCSRVLTEGEHILVKVVADGITSDIEIPIVVGGPYDVAFNLHYIWDGSNLLTFVHTAQNIYIEVYGKSTAIKPIDEKFIPDSIARKDDVDKLVGGIDKVLDEIISLQNQYIEGAML